jgi:hypothetical protein
MQWFPGPRAARVWQQRGNRQTGSHQLAECRDGGRMAAEQRSQLNRAAMPQAARSAIAAARHAAGPIARVEPAGSHRAAIRQYLFARHTGPCSLAMDVCARSHPLLSM